MITESFINAVFVLLNTVISVIPSTSTTVPGWSLQAYKLIRSGLVLFPADVWGILISNVVFWLTVQFTWALIEWVYKKIPGVN